MIVVYMHAAQGSLLLRFPGHTLEYVQQWFETRRRSGTFAILNIYRVEYEEVR